MSNISSLKELHNVLISVNKKYKFFNNVTPLSQLISTVKTDSPIITYALKDNISTKEHPLTCSSKILEGYFPNYDSTVSSLLKHKENWVNLGKLNLDEFGMGSGGVHSANGAVVNPIYDPIKNEVSDEGNFQIEHRVTGGSSSGSAAICSARTPLQKKDAIFDRLAHFALGTDTGGSVRLPAAWCNVLSFKPTYGRISRYGVLPYAHSLDTVGIISSDLKIIKDVYDILDKYDTKDPTSMSESIRKNIKKTDFNEENDVVSVGLIKEFNLTAIPDTTNQILFQFLEGMMNLKGSFELKEVSVKDIGNSLPIYFTLAPAEAASNLARFDGLRYGAKSNLEKSKDNGMFAETRALFGEEVQKRILLGNYNLSSELYDNKYKKAQIMRTEIISQFNDVFKDQHPIYPSNKMQNDDKVDVIISLTGNSKAPLLKEFLESNSHSPLDEFCNDIFTIPMSLAGIPVVSIPIKDSGISIQISGQFGYDDKVLRIAKRVNDLLL
ncbi:hypothetical protein QEN19_002476 [Hanseniaspora menglaensis]